MTRTGIVLAVVAALLGGYILLFERGSVSTGEREQRKGAALTEFVRTRISKLEIQRKGVTIVLSRDPDAAPENEASEWHVQAPYRAKADQEAVDTLLGELEWLDGRHRLEGIDAKDRARFGFEKPRYRLWFTVGKQRVPVVVGNRSARDDGVYVSALDSEQAFVVGKELVETLDQEPGHYHSKELYDDVLVALSVSLALRDSEGERVMRKRDDGLWEFERGAVGLASLPTIRTVIEALKELRARRFVAQDVKELDRYGLSAPRFGLTLDQNRFGDKKDAKGKPIRERVSLQLRAGGACEGHPGESYFTVGDQRSVFCVGDEDLKKLQKPLAELREERLLPLEDDELTSVQVTHGNAKLIVRKNGEAWSYDASGTSGGAQHGEARSEAVSDWLKGLRAQRALRFLPRAPAISGPNAFVLRVERGEGKPAYEARVGSAGGAELIAQRGDEPQSLALAQSATEQLEPSAARFRKLALRSDAAASPQRIEIQRGAELERIERAADGTGFTVSAPVTAPADAVAASELARLLGSLEAVRFVADAAQPSHGLAQPALQLAVQYAAPTAAPSGTGKAPAPLGLRIGAATEGGRFATLEGDPAVFVVSSQLVDLASAPLVSRTALATPLERLRSAEFEQPGRRVRIERQAGGTFDAGKDTPLPAGVPVQLAEALATLRASRTVAYGPAARDQGFDKPALRIAISADRPGGGEENYAIVLGAEIETGRYARRSDLPVTFVLPKDAADKLLAPPAP